MNKSKCKLNKKCKFTAEEDEQLKKLVDVYGENSWEAVASEMVNRNVRQCHDRWIYYLSPNVKTAPWTESEEEFLIQTISKLGKKWTQVSKHFPGRNDIQIKNKWNTLKKTISKEYASDKKEKKTKKAKIAFKPKRLEPQEDLTKIVENNFKFTFEFYEDAIFDDIDNLFFTY